MLWPTSVCWSVLLVVTSLCGGSIASSANQTSEVAFKNQTSEVAFKNQTSEVAFKNQTSEDSFDEEGETQIINGEAIPQGRFPFMAAVVANDYLHCGGSIISKRFVLTAAHCVKHGNDHTWAAHQLRVGVGSVYHPSLTWHPVEWAKPDKGFRRSKLSNGYDLAIIKLKHPLTLQKGRVETIALAPPGSPVPGKLSLIGWGHTRNFNAKPVQHLRGVDVNIISLRECTRISHVRFTNNNIFCDKGNNKGFCNGDSGSPLFNKVNGRFVQHGIVSGGVRHRCGNLPGFSTKVSAFTKNIYAAIQ